MKEKRDFVPVFNGKAWMLNEEDAKKACAWLQAHHNRLCQLCWNGDYDVHPVVYTPILFDVVPREQPCIPLLPRVCRSCGHVQFFSAVVALAKE